MPALYALHFAAFPQGADAAQEPFAAAGRAIYQGTWQCVRITGGNILFTLCPAHEKSRQSHWVAGSFHTVKNA
jgi:hypothetical protein